MLGKLISLFCPPRTSPIIPLAPDLGQSSDLCPQAHPCHRSLPSRTRPHPCGKRRCRPTPPHPAQPDLLVPYTTVQCWSEEGQGAKGKHSPQTAKSAPAAPRPAPCPLGQQVALLLCTPVWPAASGEAFLGACSPDLPPPCLLGVGARKPPVMRGPCAVVSTASGFTWRWYQWNR